jgi:hypothetical protein
LCRPFPERLWDGDGIGQIDRRLLRQLTPPFVRGRPVWRNLVLRRLRPGCLVESVEKLPLGSLTSSSELTGSLG